jgi:hypothetical protein
MEYLVLAEMKNGRLKVEHFWSYDEAKGYSADVKMSPRVKAAFLYRAAE